MLKEQMQSAADHFPKNTRYLDKTGLNKWWRKGTQDEQ